MANSGQVWPILSRTCRVGEALAPFSGHTWGIEVRKIHIHFGKMGNRRQIVAGWQAWPFATVAEQKLSWARSAQPRARTPTCASRRRASSWPPVRYAGGRSNFQRAIRKQCRPRTCRSAAPRQASPLSRSAGPFMCCSAGYIYTIRRTRRIHLSSVATFRRERFTAGSPFCCWGCRPLSTVGPAGREPDCRTAAEA